MAVWRRGKPTSCCTIPIKAANTQAISSSADADSGIVCSMSRSGNVWDNAAMESFFSSLKMNAPSAKPIAPGTRPEQMCSTTSSGSTTPSGVIRRSDTSVMDEAEAGELNAPSPQFRRDHATGAGQSGSGRDTIRSPAACFVSRASTILQPGLRQNNPPGKSLLIFGISVKPKNQKYSASHAAQITGMTPRVSPDERGVSRTSRTRGGMRWTRRLRQTNAGGADGEAVWSWRPDAGVKFARSKTFAGDGGKKARSPGRARYKP